MAEQIRFGLIGAEDLSVGTGNLEVRLADGRVVTLTQISLVTLPGLIPVYATSGALPTAATAGRLGRVGQAIYMDNGSAWEILAQTAYTATAIPYADATGALTEASTILTYNNSTQVLTVPAAVSVAAAGASANMTLKPKGSTGQFIIVDGNGNTVLDTAAAVASTVNNIRVTGSAASSPVILSTVGTDSNINLSLAPKGSSASTKIVSVTGNVNPQANATYNLGTASLKWLSIYGSTLYGNLSSVTGALSVQPIAASGTDQVGNELDLYSGVGTGTGASGDIKIYYSPQSASSGASANASVERLVLRGTAVALTKSSATAILDIVVPTTLTSVGGTIFATQMATDGVDIQTLTSVVQFSVVNKAGTLTTTITNLTTTDAKALSAGTFTATWTLATSGTTATVKINGVPSITPSTYRVTYSVMINTTSAGWSLTYY